MSARTYLETGAQRRGPVRAICAAVAGFGMLMGCSDPEIRLPGERLDLRGAPVASVQDGNVARPISLPAAQMNASWSQRNGGAAHRIAHPSLSANLTQIFAVNIGAGNSRRARITADPVVSAGRVFTMDAAGQVVASTTGGAAIWARDLSPPLDAPREASGGGLAAGNAVVIASTGFGQVVAMDPATGGVFWRQDLDAPGTSAPTIAGDLAYVIARDGRAWALDLSSGRIRWTHSGNPAPTNYAGGAGAAVAGDIAIFPLTNGEVLATFPEGGLRRWSTNVTGARPGQAAATLSDLASDPVIDGNRVYVGNVSGRVAALSLANGDRIWTATDGAVSPVWPAGGSVFLVNDLSQLVRLDAADGTAIWRVQLPGFVETRERRQHTRFAHYGPILAGGRLIVASGDGVIRQFDPISGGLVGMVELPGGAASAPVVAGGVLYVVSQNGQLHAFR